MYKIVIDIKFLECARWRVKTGQRPFFPFLPTVRTCGAPLFLAGEHHMATQIGQEMSKQRTRRGARSDPIAIFLPIRIPSN